MSSTVFVDGLAEFLDSYDGYIMDQWGVLHNGVEPYPGVLEGLRELKAHKKQIIILSNSGKRAEPSTARLSGLGIRRDLYKEVVTAGEVTWRGLNEQKDAPFKGLGKKCLLFSRNGDRGLIEGLDLEIVTEPEEANFILISGTHTPESTIEDYEPALRRAVAHGIPAICANPDIVGIYGNERTMGPGAVARRYQEFGGVAHYIGKPHAPIFKYCLGLFDNVMPARVLVVGDSLSHDIAGGQTLDLDTAFITTGIHANAFKRGMTEDQLNKNMDQLAQNYGARPKWALTSLIWKSAEARARDRERARIRV